MLLYRIENINNFDLWNFSQFFGTDSVEDDNTDNVKTQADEKGVGLH